MPHSFNGDINIGAIYLKCINRTATPNERKQFVEWINSPENEKATNELLLSDLDKDIWEEHADGQTHEQIIQAIFWLDKQKSPYDFAAGLQSADHSSLTSSSPVHRVHFLKRSWFRYAAVLLLIAGAAAVFYLNEKPQQNIVRSREAKKQDVQPGGNKAILTLANGDTIILDAASIGALATEGSTKILKLNAGEIAYQAGISGNQALSNTISTPKGGQYQIVLPDGTRVWLNAASSITFPTSFQKERRVAITGEAYFEVAKNKEQPFIVDAGGTAVKVLGTSFNINAYFDEASVKTVLAEGSVQVLKDDKALILKPGQQCEAVSGRPLLATDADIEKALAWKNGSFFFRRTNLADAMRQLSRWYDVDVVYEKGVPAILLGGEMKRDLTLSQVLEALGELGVRFRIEKKQLIVMND